MRIIIIGGSGFIGQALARRLAEDGHAPVIISRNKQRARDIFGEMVETREWDGRSPSALSALLDNADAIVNLAGENIGQRRWSAKRKARITHSRVSVAKNLAEAIGNCLRPPGVLIQASGSGIYGIAPPGECTEESPPGTGFIAGMVCDWEAAAAKVKEYGVRLVYLRNGVILGKGSVFSGRIAGPFRFGIGVVPGNGRNWLSWIHLDDVVSAICFLLGNHRLEGPFNLASPNPVTMEEMVRVTGQALGHRWVIKAPDLLLKLIFGEMAREAILASQRVKPARLLNSGFRFRYPQADEAVKASFATLPGKKTIAGVLTYL